MIFGFNTDIKYGDTVYHVQSEVREHDRLLQTQVFVKGRCLGKYATSFAERAGEPGFTEDHLHDILKAQHKHFVDCARAGTIMEEIESGRGVPAEAPPVQDQPMAAPASATRAFASSAGTVPPFDVPQPAADADPFASLRTSAPLVDPLEALLSPAAEQPKQEASAAAFSATEQPTPAPPPPLMHADEVPEESVERPPDPMLDSFMAELEAAEKAPPPPPIQQYRVEVAGNVIGKGIGLDCLEPIVAPDGSSVLLNVQVSEEGNPSNGAQITCRIAMPNGPAVYVYSTSNASGIADLKIATTGLQPSTGVLIQAAVHGKSASRKFNLRKA